MESPDVKDSMPILDDGSVPGNCHFQDDQVNKTCEITTDLSEAINTDGIMSEKSSSIPEFSNGMDSIAASANEALHLLEEKPVMPCLEPVSNELTDIFEETDDGSENFPPSEENSQQDSEKVTEKDVDLDSDLNIDANAVEASDIHGTDDVGGENNVVIEKEVDIKVADDHKEDENDEQSCNSERDDVKKANDSMDDDETVLLIGGEQKSSLILHEEAIEPTEYSTSESKVDHILPDEMEHIPTGLAENTEDSTQSSAHSENMLVEDKTENSQDLVETSENIDKVESPGAEAVSTTELQMKINETQTLQALNSEPDAVSLKVSEDSTGLSPKQTDSENCAAEEQNSERDVDEHVNDEQEEICSDSNDLSFTITNVSGGETIFTATTTDKESNEEDLPEENASLPVISSCDTVTSDAPKGEECKQDTVVESVPEDAESENRNKEDVQDIEDSSAVTSIDEAIKSNDEEGMEVDTSESTKKHENNDQSENKTDVGADEEVDDKNAEEDIEMMEIDEVETKSSDKTNDVHTSQTDEKTVDAEDAEKPEKVKSEEDRAKSKSHDNDVSSEAKTDEVVEKKESESIHEKGDTPIAPDVASDSGAPSEKVEEKTEKMEQEDAATDLKEDGNNKAEIKGEENDVEISTKKEADIKQIDDDVVEIVDDDVAIINDEPAKKPTETPDVKMVDNDMGLQISAVSGGVDMGETAQKVPVQADTTTPDVKSNGDKKKEIVPKVSPPKAAPPAGTKIQCCIVCKKMGKCKYNIVRNGDIKHLCDDECFKKFRASPTVFLKPSANAAPQQQQQQQKTTTPAMTSSASAITNNSQSKYKTCSVCQLMNINTSKPFLNWQGLDFCGEECLGTFQGALNTACGHCGTHIPPASKAKYCVKVGNEVRQVCNQKCQTELKRNLKLCAFCQKDLSGSVNSFMAPVGGQGTFKDFCSQTCLQKFEELSNKELEIVGVEKGRTMGKCSVCNKNGMMKHDIKLENKIHRLCGDPCFSAFQYANKLTLNQCDNCRMNLSGESSQAQYVQYEGQQRRFCSSICVNQFRTLNKKIIPCAWCGTKKVNFDMIERVDANNKYQMFCSLNCLSLYRVNLQATSNLAVVCDHCRKFVPAQYHLTMSDASVRNFCSYTCVMSFQSQFSSQGNKPNQPIPASQPNQNKVSHGHNTRAASGALPPNKIKQVQQTPPQPVKQQVVMPPAPSRPSLTQNNVPVISSVVSLAPQGGQKQQTVNLRSTTQVPVVVSNQSTTVKTGMTNTTPATVQQQIIIQPPPPKEVKNKSLLCKPFVQTKATSCRPHTQTKECQTEKREPDKILIPVPVPIFVPCPMAMYNIPAPYPVPVPVPIAVPCFIPTTKKSANGILRHIKEIQERIPTDPFEAELLRMAEAVATAEKGDCSSSDTEDEAIPEDPVPVSEEDFEEKKVVPKLPESNDLGEDMIQIALRMATEMTEESVEDLENSIEPVPLNTDQPPAGRIIDEEYDEAEYILARDGKNRRSTGAKRTARGGGRRPSKKARYEDQYEEQMMLAPEEKKPPPDANLHLKFTYGINAWKHWVMIKNGQLESVAKQGSGRLKLFKTDILQCTPDELNFSLCLFVKEVRKPNGDEYASDSIYYLCLGIQQYLFENGRMDNIFTDVYFEKFTECLNDLLYRYEPKLNIQGQIVCRIEEEHLWESKQLGAHSPNVLLNTLIYFNTKFFMLRSPQEHLRLAFSQIMKHWKKAPIKGVNQGRNVYLRYYAPAANMKGTPDLSSKKTNKEDLIVYEQAENVDNPLRCPVKLYEFYLSKCSIKPCKYGYHWNRLSKPVPMIPDLHGFIEKTKISKSVEALFSPESTKNRNDMFYLVPERSCVPDSPVWYSAHPLTPEVMGKMLNRLKLVREIQEAHLHTKPEYV